MANALVSLAAAMIGALAVLAGTIVTGGSAGRQEQRRTLLDTYASAMASINAVETQLRRRWLAGEHPLPIDAELESGVVQALGRAVIVAPSDTYNAIATYGQFYLLEEEEVLADIQANDATRSTMLWHKAVDLIKRDLAALNRPVFRWHRR